MRFVCVHNRVKMNFSNYFYMWVFFTLLYDIFYKNKFQISKFLNLKNIKLKNFLIKIKNKRFMKNFCKKSLQYKILLLPLHRNQEKIKVAKLVL